MFTYGTAHGEPSSLSNTNPRILVFYSFARIEKRESEMSAAFLSHLPDRNQNLWPDGS